MKTRMDAAVPMDAQNAPTGTWNTAQNAVSHSAHTQHRSGGRRKKNESYNVNPASHTKFLTGPRNFQQKCDSHHANECKPGHAP